MNGIGRKPARAVAELASARQHQGKLAGHHGARGGGYGRPWGVRVPRRGSRRPLLAGRLFFGAGGRLPVLNGVGG